VKLSILVIDDETFITDSVQKILLRSGHEVVTANANDGPTGLHTYRSQHFDILIVDLVMPDLSGLGIIRKAKEMDPDAFIVVITGYGTIENAVEALKMGASEFLLKPITNPLLLNVINRRIEHLNSRRENQELRRLNQELFQQVSRRHGFGELIGLNPGILSIYKLIGDLLTVDVNILITGETGTGGCQKRSFKVNSSAMKKGPSRALSLFGKANSSWQTVEHSSWTRWVTWACQCSKVCFAFWKQNRLNGLVGKKPYLLMFASSPPPMPIL